MKWSFTIRRPAGITSDLRPYQQVVFTNRSSAEITNDSVVQRKLYKPEIWATQYSLWSASPLRYLKVSPQFLHLCGLRPAWSSLCDSNRFGHRNDLPHSSHLYGLIPVWVRRWFLSVLPSANRFPQVGHIYGLSPVCSVSCCFRLETKRNILRQTLHCNGLVKVRLWTYCALSGANTRTKGWLVLISSWVVSSPETELT